MTPDINAGKVMQMATVRDSTPWICTVYFVFITGKFYWLSFPERRHSRDITGNNKIAVAIALESEQPVVGVQAEGWAEVVDDESEVADVMKGYAKKYNQGGEFLERFRRGDNHHQMYRLNASKIMMFDERTPGVESYRNITNEVL